MLRLASRVVSTGSCVRTGCVCSSYSILSGDGGSDSESSDSDEETESPSRESISSSGSDEDEAKSPQGSPLKERPVAKDGDHKMEVDSSDGRCP